MHCTKDSFSFCEEIKKVRASNKFLVFYNVCSLLTIIPLTETVDIAIDLLFEKKPGFKILKADLKKLFQFATSGAQFMLGGKFYYQIDWVAMGHHWALFLLIFLWGIMNKSGYNHLKNVK